MSTTAKVRLAKYVRDLLQQPELEVVIIGRENVRRDNYAALQIVIDSLVPAISLSRGEKFDGEIEFMTHSQQWSSTCSIDFYGDAANDEARKFSLLTQTERSSDLQIEHELTVYNPTGLTDVKLLTGSLYSNQLQLSVTVHHTEELAVPTLRIDEAQLEFNPG